MKPLASYIDRPKSVLTGRSSLETLYRFKDFPVFFGGTEAPSQEDLVADMDWALDHETGMVQLTKLIPLEILYHAQHVDGCGPTWQAYYEAFADYIVSFKPQTVVEIGGGMGVLAQRVTSTLSQLEWHIVEPNPAFEPSGRIHVQKEFFTGSTVIPAQADMVVFSQVLEHAYDPKEFMLAIATFLKPGGKVVFAYPHLLKWLQEKYTNALNFEHTMLLTDEYLDPMLPALGFTPLDKTQYKEHSFFYAAERNGDEPRLDTIAWPDLTVKHRQAFNEFITHHVTMVEELNRQMHASTVPVYLFGAHIFSTYLFSFGLEKEKIVGMLDNSPTKRGKRFYGTEFTVESPEILRGKGPVQVIVKAGIYTEEIKQAILEKINPEVKFL